MNQESVNNVVVVDTLLVHGLILIDLMVWLFLISLVELYFS